MGPITRFIIGVITLCVLLFLFLNWSWWLTLFAVLGIITAVTAKYFDKIQGAVGLALVVIIALIALGYFHILPSVSRQAATPANTANCATNPTERLANAVHSDASRRSAYAPPSAFQQRRIEIERDAGRDLFQAGAAVDVDVTVTAVARILDLQSAPGLEDARRTVNTGAEDIRRFLSEKGLSGRDQRKQGFTQLEQQIRGLLAQLKATTTADQLDPIRSAVFQADNDAPISQLAQKMFSLEESLLALTRQSVATSPAYSIEFDGTQRATYRETITVRSLQDGLLDSLDASLLKREADSDGLPFTLWLQSGNGTPVKVNDPAHILIEPPQQTVNLIYERLGPVSVPDYCDSAPLGAILRVLFIWPPSGPSVRLGGVVVKGDERLPVWFPVDRSKPETQFLEDIRLPQNSVFATAQTLDLATRDGHDILTTVHHEDLALRNFAADKNNWVELFNDNFVLRNSVTQRFRDYLVVENTISAAFVFGLTALVFVIFPKLK